MSLIISRFLLKYGILETPEEVLGEVGSVMWEEDTENEDMVKQVGDSCIAVQYVCGAVENSMQLGTTRW